MQQARLIDSVVLGGESNPYDRKDRRISSSDHLRLG
jgi:hypothetical protein